MSSPSRSGDLSLYDSVLLILAVLFIASPWMLGYSGDRHASISSCFLGAAIAVFVISTMSEYSRIYREAIVALGGLAAAAPWLLRFAADHRAATAHVVIGCLVIIISAGELWLTGGHPPHVST